MNEYEKYRLQWMLDHDYSLPDLLERLSDIAMNENLDEIQNPRVMLNEAFEICNKSFNELFSELKPSQTIFIEEVGDVIKTFGILDMKLDDISLKANCLNFE